MSESSVAVFLYISRRLVAYLGQVFRMCETVRRGLEQCSHSGGSGFVKYGLCVKLVCPIRSRASMTSFFRLLRCSTCHPLFISGLSIRSRVHELVVCCVHSSWNFSCMQVRMWFFICWRGALLSSGRTILYFCSRA